MKRAADDDHAGGSVSHQRQRLVVSAQMEDMLDALKQGNDTQRHMYEIFQIVNRAHGELEFTSKEEEDEAEGCDAEDLQEDVLHLLQLCTLNAESTLDGLERAPVFGSGPVIAALEESSSSNNDLLAAVQSASEHIVSFLCELQAHCHEHEEEMAKLEEMMKEVCDDTYELKQQAGQANVRCEELLHAAQKERQESETRLTNEVTSSAPSFVSASSSSSSDTSKAVSLALQLCYSDNPEIKRLMEQLRQAHEQQNELERQARAKAKLNAYRSGVHSLCLQARVLFTERVRASRAQAVRAHAQQQAQATTAAQVLLPRLAVAVRTYGQSFAARQEVIEEQRTRALSEAQGMRDTDLGELMPTSLRNAELRVEECDRALAKDARATGKLVRELNSVWGRAGVPEDVKSLVRVHLEPVVAGLPPVGQHELDLKDKSSAALASSPVVALPPAPSPPATATPHRRQELEELEAASSAAAAAATAAAMLASSSASRPPPPVRPRQLHSSSPVVWVDDNNNQQSSSSSSSSSSARTTSNDCVLQ